MIFEFDEEKSLRTLEERGLDFAYAARIFEGPVIEWDSPRRGEHRIKATGQVDQRFITVVYTWRGDARRIISARAARRSERDAYRAQNLER
jgi:uncharacterized DUF497 family protein